MLYGRSREQADIERLLAEARAGQSGTLVIRGQAGIGKSALLHHAAARAEDMRVLRGVGIESEAELPFAALHSLLRTGLGRIRTLPDAQATALSGALGLGDVAPENRFLVGLATLSLLSEIAGDGALLCLIDDAQWFDQASIDALLFAARRLDAEGVAMIFAAREGFPAAGLSELRLGGLDDAAAAALLPDVLLPQVRERLIEEADGNPLALIELPAALTAEQRAGRLSPVGAMPVADRVQEMFRNQIAALPEAARTALLIAAADGSGELETVVGAGASLQGLESAERNRLMEIRGTTIGFRHPLIRAAAYQSAPVTRRLAVHRALADALTDSVAVDAADRRAWHLASAVLGTDEGVARELEEVAERARTRGGYAATAAAYERAAELTADPVRRSGRLAAAALAASDAGLMGRAAALADSATPDVDDPLVISALIQVRAHREFEQGTPLAAGRIVMDGVPRVMARSSERATWLLVEAIRCAWSAGDAGLAEEAAAGLRVLPEIDSPLVRGALGLTRMLSGDIGGGTELMGEAVDGHALAELGVPGLTFTASLCFPLGRAARYEEIAGRVVAECRKSGMIGWLAVAFQDHGLAQGWLCRYGEARATLNAGLRLAAELGHEHQVSHLMCSLAWVLAHQGDVEQCRANAEEGIARADGQGLALAAAIGRWALGRLELGLGRPDAALQQFEAIPSTGLTVLSAADQVEAAIRGGRPERAKEPLARYLEWARHVRQPSSDAIALRCRALVEKDEAHFAHAVRCHEAGDQPYEQARTQLAYGEWLRRARRRADARAQLRGALEIFDRLGAELWAERARAELRATGDVPAAPRKADDPLSVLTPRERQIVRLAANGTSNRDIAAQLFLSPRTVGYHLYKAFPKLGITSRSQLAAVARSSPVPD
ncbi:MULTISPECIES: helix-turn-helix transcriptional regulator [Streptosporangium]|uniref:DNA-binding CsgD family transcriptional regulator n=1 Tax=Streptosporangium brasiliense TaxID=47480 RepID=A0ABT9R6Z9_9ACTN|nr:helix-turn-helix transcriptional regulator [Streptosporangium brasiliense]MDP9864170.1 DNA-binding CsgD family transcriptional regulator [Streptosporangium brasiliense]